MLNLTRGEQWARRVLMLAVGLGPVGAHMAVVGQDSPVWAAGLLVGSAVCALGLAELHGVVALDRRLREVTS